MPLGGSINFFSALAFQRTSAGLSHLFRVQYAAEEPGTGLQTSLLQRRTRG